MNILCALARGPLEAKLGNVRATTSFVWTESRAPSFCFKGSRTGSLHITIRGTLASFSGELRRQCNQAPAWKAGTKGGTRAACRGRRRHCVITRKAGDERELRPVDVAEYPILDQRFEVLVMRLPTPREQHHMFDPAPLRRLQHAPRVGSIVSKRLFAENVQALIDCRERHSKVLVVRRRYDDRVEATICDELPVVGECCCDALFGRHLCESGGITSGDGGNLYVGAIAEVRQIHEFHPVAGPDNAQPNTVSHVSPWTVAGAVHLPKRGSQTGGPSCRNTIHSHRSQRTAPTTVDAPQWTPEETWQHVRACRSGASGLDPHPEEVSGIAPANQRPGQRMPCRPIRFTGRSRSGALVLVEDRGSSRNQLRDLSAEPFELRRIIAGQALKTPPCP